MVSYATGRVDRGGDGRTPVGIVIQPVLNLAVGHGEIRLRSDEPSVQSSIDLNLLAESSDRQRLGDALRLSVKLGQHSAFANIVGERIGPSDELLDSPAALDRWLLREVTHTHHLSGTCKMGPAADPMAVIDQRGRVHGIAGLRVADCSVMPDCVRANTNATAMMIGERLADLIAED